MAKKTRSGSVREYLEKAADNARFKEIYMKPFRLRKRGEYSNLVIFEDKYIVVYYYQGSIEIEVKTDERTRTSIHGNANGTLSIHCQHGTFLPGHNYMIVTGGKPK